MQTAVKEVMTTRVIGVKKGATFTCTSVGTFTVSVSVDDGTPAMACVDSASVNVTCTALPGGM